MVQVLASRSISVHAAFNVSDVRDAHRIVNSNASLTRRRARAP